MATIVHFEPADQRLSWKLHVWQANASWDLTATTNGKFLDFSLPVVADVRKLRFKFRSIDPVSQQEIWESDDYIRAINTLKPEEVWTFSGSARISYKQPFPTTVKFNVGDKIYLSVFTRNQYKGGQVYIWNPYQVGSPTLILDETARNDQSFTSTFTITLTAWMVNGFHFKLTKINAWEPELSNRFWRPDDGANLWIKAGQVDVRQEALATVNLPIEVLVPSASPDPKLALIDLYDNYNGDLQSISSTAYPASNRFRIVNYQAQIFPGAAYNLTTKNNPENPNITLPFPSNPDDLNSVSRLALGVADWQASFPETVSNIILVIEPAKTNSGLGNGFDVAIGLGNAHAYQTASAVKQHNGLWQVVLESLPNITTSIQLLPVNGQESKLYDWIDTSRTLLPPTDPSTFYTTEGVFGISSSGVSQFSEPADRNAVLAAAFSKAIVDNGVFENYELPHGATLVENSVYFVIHAPHAVTCALVLVQQNTQGHASRNIIDMFLTNDRRYWWCQVPAVDAPPSTRYRFRLNENIEVLDPAAREISKGNLWETTVSDDPADPNTTWSLVLDTLAVYNAAHRQPWQTLGWDALVIYELHAKRFTDIQSDNLTPLALLADELQPVSRTGQPGYLYKLPVTALELLPIHEFKPNSSWGYNPAGYFAIESTYGGAYALAEFVNSAHASGRGVILDLVYNHSQDSPLVKIARDVYRNGDSYGDRVNCGHPIVLEFLRQASIHLWRTFGIDGFRFDDTKTIVTLCQGGWQFLGAIREAIRKAANIFRVSSVTTINAALAAMQGLFEQQEHPLEVKSLQEYHQQ